jgi:transposase-like protein
MIPKKRKSYTREFKIETVKLVTDGGASANQIWIAAGFLGH